eukprot:scaffold76341_cov17-Prasinocladus_malaysianus.AAC.1
MLWFDSHHYYACHFHKPGQMDTMSSKEQNDREQVTWKGAADQRPYPFKTNDRSSVLPSANNCAQPFPIHEGILIQASTDRLQFAKSVVRRSGGAAATLVRRTVRVQH